MRTLAGVRPGNLANFGRQGNESRQGLAGSLLPPAALRRQHTPPRTAGAAAGWPALGQSTAAHGGGTTVKMAACLGREQCAGGRINLGSAGARCTPATSTTEKLLATTGCCSWIVDRVSAQDAEITALRRPSTPGWRELGPCASTCLPVRCLTLPDRRAARSPVRAFTCRPERCRIAGRMLASVRFYLSPSTACSPLHQPFYLSPSKFLGRHARQCARSYLPARAFVCLAASSPARSPPRASAWSVFQCCQTAGPQARHARMGVSAGGAQEQHTKVVLGAHKRAHCRRTSASHWRSVFTAGALKC